MAKIQSGDIVYRKSYGGDVLFKVVSEAKGTSRNKEYILRGLVYRIIADADEDDLERISPEVANEELQRSIELIDTYRSKEETRNNLAFNLFNHPLFSFLKNLQASRGKPGKILHIDSSAEFIEMCSRFYKNSDIKFVTREIAESEQPKHIQSLLKSTNADILVVTGHDAMKKDSSDLHNLRNYRHSAHFIKSVVEARKVQKNKEQLCIFAGACQSYFEGIMEAGANFASSPGRILIHALDPSKVAERVALTDSKYFVTPERIARITESGLEGIGGIKTRGHYVTK
jgi:spore coat assembly protein